MKSPELTNQLVGSPALVIQTNSSARQRSLLIVKMTMCVACITLFNSWASFNDLTYQSVPGNSTGCGGRYIIV